MSTPIISMRRTEDVTFKLLKEISVSSLKKYKKDFNLTSYIDVFNVTTGKWCKCGGGFNGSY